MVLPKWKIGFEDGLGFVDWDIKDNEERERSQTGIRRTQACNQMVRWRRRGRIFIFNHRINMRLKSLNPLIALFESP